MIEIKTRIYNYFGHCRIKSEMINEYTLMAHGVEFNLNSNEWVDAQNNESGSGIESYMRYVNTVRRKG